MPPTQAAQVRKRSREGSVGEVKEEDVPFPEGDRASLAIVALLARDSVCTALSMELLDELLTTPPTPPQGSASPSVSKDLVAAYPEVRALRCVLTIRLAIYGLQRLAGSDTEEANSSPSTTTTTEQQSEDAQRRALFATAGAAFHQLYTKVIPDELFAALSKVIRDWLREENGVSVLPPPAKTRVFEVQAMQVADALQLEVLRQTRQLTRRAMTLTLRYRHQIPFCS